MMRQISLVHGAFIAAALAVSPAMAEITLPDGVGNTIGTTCSYDVVELRMGEKAWPLEDGGQVVAEFSDKTSWDLHCESSSGGFSTVSTSCYDGGYVVAVRQGNDLKLGCYEGPVPAALK